MNNLHRFGVVGAGYWAQSVHLPALHSMIDVTVRAVYGRNLDSVRVLADTIGAAAFAKYDSFLEHVDFVSFAVPPNVQSALALIAAEAGKGLLLEKPLATSLPEAHRLVAAIERRNVASRVFLTRLFSPASIDLINAARSISPISATATFNSRALLPDSPYASSPWRASNYGALWDIAPHVLSIVIPVMGPVCAIVARRMGPAAFQCQLQHVSGGSSQVDLNLMDSNVERVSERYVFTAGGRSVSGGPFANDSQACFRAAVRSLVRGDKSQPQPCPDARFGCDLVEIIDKACASIESANSQQAFHT